MDIIISKVNLRRCNNPTLCQYKSKHIAKQSRAVVFTDVALSKKCL